MGRILHSHPAFTCGDELGLIDIAIRTMEQRDRPYPETLDDLSSDDVKAIRMAYWQAIPPAMAAKSTERWVDKHPIHVIHLPLIWRLFPAAQVLVMVRHPLDVCRSCYFQSFELNALTRCFHELESTAEFYDSVMDLFDQYHPHAAPHLHMVRYEDLVTDFDGAMRSILEYLGAPWSERIRHFHRTAQLDRAIRTPSYHQVIRPIYSDSVERWPAYASHLQTIRSVLQPWCDRFDYAG